jgi:hypothetical protein
MKPREVWDEVLAQPASGRLAVVYAAHRVADPEMLEVLCGEGNLAFPALFVTPAAAFARKDAAHLEVLAASRHAQVVRCVPPAREEDAVRLVASWWPGGGANAAAGVLQRCGGSLSMAREACEKAALAGLGEPALDFICRREPGDDFADLVVAGERGKAVTAAHEVPRTETSKVVGLLSYRLTLLVLLHAAVRDGLSPQEQVVRLKADPYVLRLLRPHARDYPASREPGCREVLALAESACRSGAETGILEAVAALW